MAIEPSDVPQIEGLVEVIAKTGVSTAMGDENSLVLYKVPLILDALATITVPPAIDDG